MAVSVIAVLYGSELIGAGHATLAYAHLLILLIATLGILGHMRRSPEDSREQLDGVDQLPQHEIGRGG